MPGPGGISVYLPGPCPFALLPPPPKLLHWETRTLVSSPGQLFYPGPAPASAVNQLQAHPRLPGLSGLPNHHCVLLSSFPVTYSQIITNSMV